MLEAMLSSPFFGLGLTCAAWCVGVFLQKKTGFLLCNPMLIATIVVVAVLAVFRIPYADYLQGSSMLTLMLSSVTAVLALNVYNQRKLLGEYFLPVIVGCLVGTLTSVGSVLLLCKLMAVDSAMTSALLPKSVTTAIAIAISENLGGIPGVTAAAVVIAGVVGAIFAPAFAKLFHVTDPVAEGVAIGTCSHALGTAKALEIGTLQGAMSSVSLCICGILTSILVLFF